MNADFQSFLRRNVLIYGEQLTLEVPLVPPGTLSPGQVFTLHFGAKENRRAYVRASRAQQRAWEFARKFLGKRKPNPDPVEAKKYPTVSDSPVAVVDVYLVLRNKEIQAWNAFAKLSGLPLLPMATRRGRTRLLVDSGPEPVQRIMPIMPMAGPIGDSRRSAREPLYDADAFVPPLDPPPSLGGLPRPSTKPPFSPVGGRGSPFDHESWRPRNSGPR
jgi:hypothetical protein